MAFQEKTNQLMNQIGQVLTFTASHQAKQKATESLKEQQAVKSDLQNIKQAMSPEAFAIHLNLADKVADEMAKRMAPKKPGGNN